MIPKPIALGLQIAERVIVEEGTRNLSGISLFTELHTEEFPFRPDPFFVLATLTGTQEEGRLMLTVTRLATEEETSILEQNILFRDRFEEVVVLIPLSRLEFLDPGAYMFTLLIDGDAIAHRRFTIHTLETES